MGYTGARLLRTLNPLGSSISGSELSSFCSQTPWPHGGGAANALLSSCNSRGMSSGLTYEASFSDTRFNRVICPMNLSVVATDKKKRRL
jgi:hypothetical protein